MEAPTNSVTPFNTIIKIENTEECSSSSSPGQSEDEEDDFTKNCNKRVSHGNQRKYATLEEKRIAKAEKQRKRRKNMTEEERLRENRLRNERRKRLSEAERSKQNELRRKRRKEEKAKQCREGQSEDAVNDFKKESHGNQRKYATLEEKRIAKAEKQRKRRQNMTEEERLRENRLRNERRKRLSEAERSRINECRRNQRKEKKAKQCREGQSENELNDSQKESHGNQRKYDTPEEKRLANAERLRKRRMNMTEEEKLRENLKRNERRRKQKLNEAARYRHNESRRKRKKEERDLLQKSPSELTPEERERREKILEMRTHRALYEMNWKARMTEEQKEQKRIKGYFQRLAREHARTEEEKQRHIEYNRRKALEHWQKVKVDPEKRKKQLEYIKKKQRERCEKIRKGILVIPPEKRRRQLHIYKVNAAKQKLKKKLQSEGVHEEEIKKRLKELYDEMWKAFNELPPPDPDAEVVSEYKPRPRKNTVERGKVEPDPVYVQPKPFLVKTYYRPVPLVKCQVQNNVENTTEHFSDNEFDDHFDDDSNLSCPQSPPHDTHMETSPINYSNFFGGKEEVDATVDDEDVAVSENEVVDPLERIKLCSHCEETFENDHDLRQHMFQTHLNKCWKCPMCKEFSLTPAEFTEHFQKSHSSSNQSSTSQNASEGTSESNSLKFSCYVCSEKFMTQKELSNHVKNQHPTRYFLCQRCDILRYSEKSLMLHTKHCGKRPNVNKLK